MIPLQPKPSSDSVIHSKSCRQTVPTMQTHVRFLLCAAEQLVTMLGVCPSVVLHTKVQWLLLLGPESWCSTSTGMQRGHPPAWEENISLFPAQQCSLHKPVAVMAISSLPRHGEDPACSPAEGQRQRGISFVSFQAPWRWGRQQTVLVQGCSGRLNPCEHLPQPPTHTASERPLHLNPLLQTDVCRGHRASQPTLPNCTTSFRKSHLRLFVHTAHAAGAWSVPRRPPKTLLAPVPRVGPPLPLTSHRPAPGPEEEA